MLRDLGTLGGSFGFATWINDAGTVVGFATPASEDLVHGFLWANGAMTDLGLLDDNPCNVPFFVNAGGQIVGASNCFGGVDRPFLWENGGRW